MKDLVGCLHLLSFSRSSFPPLYDLAISGKADLPNHGFVLLLCCLYTCEKVGPSRETGSYEQKSTGAPNSCLFAYYRSLIFRGFSHSRAGMKIGSCQGRVTSKEEENL
jgi:hypothetical protein